MRSTAFAVIVSVVLVQIGAQNAIGDADYDLRVLSKQVKALVERRTEDLRSIEESVRRTVFNGPEVEELRDQVRSLKTEIDQLRTGTVAPPTPQSKNEKLTVKWLSNTVQELRSEISELQNTLNSSILLQDHEVHQAQISLLQSDISSLSGELERFRTLNARKDADMRLLQEELNSLRSDWRSMAEVNGRLRNQLKSMQLEWAHDMKALQEKETLPLPAENSSHPRHQRVLRQHVVHLEKTTRSLHKENALLQDRVKQLEEQQQSNHESNHINEINELDLQQVLALEMQLNNLSEQQLIHTGHIAELSKQIDNFDKVHLSMLELLENVESLENKVDKALPELRKEISKVESQTGQMVADIAPLKEDHNNIKESMKAIGFSVSKLQDKDSEDAAELQKLRQHLDNLEKGAAVQNSHLHNHILKEESVLTDVNATRSTIHLVEELQSFESEYKSIVNKLPRDCGSVDGPKGIYLISPGDGEPILARCDSGWTTIQKRYDGSINFNRNWNEYSNGFGSATGEHWLGNRNLHHLTKDNCTQLSINMKDIYGKYWEASYDHFHIADYTQGFKLTVSHYHGNASDAMDYQNRMEFSTVDNDRDISNTHCASNYEGGWWFSHCQHANLNGRYNLGLTWFDGTRNEWIAVAQSEMRVKRRDVC
uniref:Fibrinogen C-terminal domain-containing protein n=1 Tax=Dendroctonus ponderosae TaxID=77166 RepID=A0AAR5PZT7_DENPD